MIKFNNYSFYYKKKAPLFQNMNFELTKGKVYGLLGKNGCGKTTLLHSISGLNFPKSGSIESYGFQPKDRNPNYSSQFVFLPDKIFLPKMSIKQFAKNYSPFYPNFSTQQFEEYLKVFEVTLKSKTNSLSFGQQKKVLIAFTLACNTPLIIMDEPANGLDIPSKKQLRKLIASSVSEDTILIISTHNIRDMEKMLDHVLIIHDNEMMVNQSIYAISEKLSFNFYDTEPDTANVLACERITGGYQTMEPNTDGDITDFDLELFFNTCVSKPTEIKALLTS